MKRILLTCVCSLILLSPLADSAAGKDDISSSCIQEEAFQFDFWLGEWNVFANDQLVGRDVITRILNGCTLFEKYMAAGGKLSGRSFYYYDHEDGLWHQVWVDDSGRRLHLSGEYANGKMVLSGDRLLNGQTVTDRISWTDNSDGTVGQLWEFSRDGGETWQVLSDALYRHVGDDAPQVKE